MSLAQFTRRLVKDLTSLHIKALVADCHKLDKAAEVAAKNVDDQKTVVSWANQELQRRRKALDHAADTADEAWRRANEEIASLPRF